MSVTASSSTSTAAASDRLAKAIAATKAPAGGETVKAAAGGDAARSTAPSRTNAKRGAKAAPDAGGSSSRSSLIAKGGAPAPERTATRKPAERTESTRAATTGAKAAPSYAATGANAAGDGAQNVQSVSPDTTTAGAGPYTPQDASADAYAAQSAAPNAAQDAHASTAAADPYAGQSEEAAAPAPVQGGKELDPRWLARFEALKLAPADIAYLASAGFDDATLEGIARELEGVPVLESGSPEPGRDAGSARSADGPTAADVAPGQPGMDPAATGGSAWTPEWEQKFGDLMKRMGMSSSEVKEQLKGAAAQPFGEEQLDEAYRQMEASLGDFDAAWRTRFSKLLGELKTPAAEKEQVLQQLAASGMTDAQLQQAYGKMDASRPAWNEKWEDKFGALEIPEEMLKQARESGASKDALEQHFKTLLDKKMEYHRDGRLDKLEDAKATPEQKWGAMMEGKKGKDFDKQVEQIHSSHVSGWKRIGSFALNMVPGAFAVQFALGKDLVTGEKINRLNPINMLGAAVSGFTGFAAARSVLGQAKNAAAVHHGLQGAKYVDEAVAGGTTIAGRIVGGTEMAANAANQARNSAAVLRAAQKGSLAQFQLRAVIGSFTRVGTSGSIATASRTWGQTASFNASTLAAKKLADGTVEIDQGVRATAMESLRASGGSVPKALRATSEARKGFKHGAAYRPDQVVARSGAVWNKAGGHWMFNPARNRATAEVGGAAQKRTVVDKVLRRPGGVPGSGGIPVINTGRTLNMATPGGFAIANGAHDAATGIRSGLTVAEHARRLGVDGGFRGLFQLSQAGRAANGSIRAAEKAGTLGYDVAHVAGRVGRAVVGNAAVPIVGGAAFGLAGRQFEPILEYMKNRKEIQAKEREAAQDAEREAHELERLYQEQNGGGGEAQAPADASGTGGPADAQEGAATTSANAPQVVGTSPTTGGQLVFDPSIGAVYDTTSGDVYDPNTGSIVGNLKQAQAAQTAATAPAAMAPGTTAPATMAPATTAPGTMAPATMAPATATPGTMAPATSGTGAPNGAQQVHVDPATGYYVDPSTGLMADPATGNVYDPRSGQVVANVNQPAA